MIRLIGCARKIQSASILMPQIIIDNGRDGGYILKDDIFWVVGWINKMSSFMNVPRESGLPASRFSGCVCEAISASVHPLPED